MPNWFEQNAPKQDWFAANAPSAEAKPKTKGDVLWEQGTPQEKEIYGGTPFVGPMGVSPISMEALKMAGKGLARGVIGKGVEKATEVGASLAGLPDQYANAVGQVAGMAATFAPRRVTDSVRDFMIPDKLKTKWNEAWTRNAPPPPTTNVSESTPESPAPAPTGLTVNTPVPSGPMASPGTITPYQGTVSSGGTRGKWASPSAPTSSAPAEAYGGTVRNGVIYDEQGAPVAYQEGAAPKEAKPPMPSRTEGAPTLHNEPLAHQQGVEGGTIQGYLTRVNDIKLGRFLSDKGISPEQVRTMPEDQLNTLIKEHNPKAKPLGKSGTFGRTVEAKREDLAKRIENVQKLTPEQYQKKLEDATREYQEQLNKAKGRGKEGRREVSKLQSLPFVPPPPVMA